MATLRNFEDESRQRIAGRRAQAQATAQAAEAEGEAAAAQAVAPRAPISPRNIFPQGSPSAGVPIYEGAGLRGLRTPPAAAMDPVSDGPGQIPGSTVSAPRAAGVPLGDVNEIPTAGYPAAPANNGTLRGSEFGRGVSNTVNALAPLGGIAGAARGAMGATGPISRGLQGVAEGITGAAALGAADRPSASLATAPTVTAPAAVASPAIDLTPASAVPGLRANGALTAPGNVMRDGNAYSGTNVTGDITIGGDGPRGGTVSAQNMMAADNLAARETLRGQASALAGAPAAGRPAFDDAPNSDNSWQARNNLRNLRVGANSIYNAKSEWGDRAAAKTARDVYENAAGLDAASRGGGDPGALARIKATADLYGDDQRAAAARYGSDASLRGTMISAGASRANSDARLRYDMAKDARDFGVRTEENATKRQENQLKSRQEAEKNMVDRLSAALPPRADGKPDTAAAAEQVRAMTARMSDRQTKLEQWIAANPGDAQAKAELANILDNGVASVGTKGLDQFQTGMDARSLRRESAGIMPWSGRDVATNKPISSLRLDKGLLFDDYVDDQGGRIPARVVEKNEDTLRGLIR